MHCLRELIKNEGAMALYKGVGPRLSRVCCEVAITMTLYGEVVKVRWRRIDQKWPRPQQGESGSRTDGPAFGLALLAALLCSSSTSTGSRPTSQNTI